MIAKILDARQTSGNQFNSHTTLVFECHDVPKRYRLFSLTRRENNIRAVPECMHMQQ
jgi:hypothetical protein